MAALAQPFEHGRGRRGVGDFDGQMHSDDVVWRDKTTGKSFAAPRETLGGMTVEGFRRRYNEPSDYLRRMNVTQN